MNPDIDTEATARANLAHYYKTLDAIMAKGSRRTGAEALILDGFCCHGGGLAQFVDAHELAAELGILGQRRLRLTREQVHSINAMIRLEVTIRQSRHGAENEHGACILAGSNGVVPDYGAGEDWIKA